MSAQNALTSAIAALAEADDSGLPRANHANAIATPEWLWANRLEQQRCNPTLIPAD